MSTMTQLVEGVVGEKGRHDVKGRFLEINQHMCSYKVTEYAM